MSRSTIKNYFRRCECCDYSKKGQMQNNRRNRRKDKQNLKNDNTEDVPTGRKSYFKLLKDFRVPKSRRDVESFAKDLAEYKSKTKKEKQSLIRRYQKKLLSK